MKYLALFILFFGLFSCEKKSNTPTLPEVLETQLIHSHSKAEWFVPINDALKGLTVEQANWRDSTENHSIAQLASHLLFWNKRLMNSFQGKEEGEFQGKNTETFADLDSATWMSTLQELDQVMLTLEKETASASPEKLEGWVTTIGNIASHNAYHTGQILYIRKMKGWWDPAQGVQ